MCGFSRAGAKVSHRLSSDTLKTRATVVTFFGITIALKKGPNVIIQVGVAMLMCHSKYIWVLTCNMFPFLQGNYNPLPGECWPFPGDHGHVVIELSHPVNISHVTVDHISRSISAAASISSAPKNFSVFVSSKCNWDELLCFTAMYMMNKRVLTSPLSGIKISERQWSPSGILYVSSRWIRKPDLYNNGRINRNRR